MTRLLAFLAALLLPALAHAQCASPLPYTFVPNTTIASAQVNANFNTVYNCANSASERAPHIGTEALLAASATTTYPDGVWRDCYSSTACADPLWYVPSGGACPLNAGAGDGGAQVPSVDGKCWLAHFPASGYDPRQWGVTCDGTTDDITKLNVVFAYLLGANGVVSFPAGKSCKVSSVLTIDIGTSTANLQSDGLKINLNGGTDLDGSSITTTPTLKILCTGVANGCNNVVINGRWTIKGGNNSGPVLEIGANDNTDTFNGFESNYLIAQNVSTAAGAIGARLNTVNRIRGYVESYLPNANVAALGTVLTNVDQADLSLAINLAGGGGCLTLTQGSGASGNGATRSTFRNLSFNCVVGITIDNANSTLNRFLQPKFAGTTTGITATGGGTANIVDQPDFVGPANPIGTGTGIIITNGGLSAVSISTCTGLGSGGSPGCAPSASSTASNGVITLTTGSVAGGTTLSFSIDQSASFVAPAAGETCNIGFANGSGNWANDAGAIKNVTCAFTASPASTVVTITTTTALATSKTYSVTYNFSPL